MTGSPKPASHDVDLGSAASMSVSVHSAHPVPTGVLRSILPLDLSRQVCTRAHGFSLVLLVHSEQCSAASKGTSSPIRWAVMPASRCLRGCEPWC